MARSTQAYAEGAAGRISRTTMTRHPLCGCRDVSPCLPNLLTSTDNSRPSLHINDWASKRVLFRPPLLDWSPPRQPLAASCDLAEGRLRGHNAGRNRDPKRSCASASHTPEIPLLTTPEDLADCHRAAPSNGPGQRDQTCAREVGLHRLWRSACPGQVWLTSCEI